MMRSDRLMWCLRAFLATWGSVLLLAGPAAAQDVKMQPTRAMEWKPPTFPNATLHARIPFLVPARQWERLDIWVPKTPTDARLPCLVAVYGGGYGDKVGGFVKDFRPLLDRGYVVAAPDYALKTNAPVPLCSWDVANAIRFLRAHAARYRIDPERIGVWGWSAGGWIAQDLCYTGPERLVRVAIRDRKTNKKTFVHLPMRQPRPQYADRSVRVQAVVSDWGAGKLWDRRTKAPRPWLSSDDPSLFTCYQGALTDQTVNPVTLLKTLGVPAAGVYGFTKNTHVPALTTPCVGEDGRKTTWGRSIHDFLDARLKTIDTATSPEMIPHGGFIDRPTAVRLLTVHPGGAIHHTLDGSEPDKASPRYAGPVEVKPGQTLKAVVIRPGLKTSRATTGTFAPGPPKPTITTTDRVFKAKVGTPLTVAFQAANAGAAAWYAGGMMGDTFRSFAGQRYNPPRHIAWMRIDARTGVLSGTPRAAGLYPVIVACVTLIEGKPRTAPTWAADAVLIVVRVEK